MYLGMDRPVRPAARHLPVLPQVPRSHARQYRPERELGGRVLQAGVGVEIGFVVGLTLSDEDDLDHDRLAREWRRAAEQEDVGARSGQGRFGFDSQRRPADHLTRRRVVPERGELRQVATQALEADEIASVWIGRSRRVPVEALHAFIASRPSSGRRPKGDELRAD